MLNEWNFNHLISVIQKKGVNFVNDDRFYLRTNHVFLKLICFSVQCDKLNFNPIVVCTTF